MTGPDEASSYRQPAHLVVGVLSGEWVIAVLFSLATQPRRSMELLDEINRHEERLGWKSHDRPLTRKVFAETVRGLQRDGLIVRTSRESQFGPVWYRLTPLGHEFLRATVPLAKLGLHHGAEIDQARARYDAQLRAAAARRSRDGQPATRTQTS